jgi:hypothetical protein
VLSYCLAEHLSIRSENPLITSEEEGRTCLKGALLTLLLGNLEHLISHKYQLLTYLKLAGVTVGTPDIYRFRE